MNKKKLRIKSFLVKSLTLFTLFLIAQPVWAESSVLLFDSGDKSYLKDFKIGAPSSTGYNLAVGDLGQDGISEIVVGARKGDEPKIFVYRGDGSLISQFYAYDKDFRGGVNVAMGDLDGNGINEIITGAGFGGGSHVRIFNVKGESVVGVGFFAFEKSYSFGIDVSTADVDGNKMAEILVATGFGHEPTVKIFKASGQIVKEFRVNDFGSLDGIKTNRVDLGGDGVDEIAVSGGYGSESKVAIYRGDGSLINIFEAYPKNFLGGLNLASFDIDKDGKEEIITAPGITGGPHIKAFKSSGQLVKELFFNQMESGRGFDVGFGNFDNKANYEIVIAYQEQKNDNVPLGHFIDVDVASQTVSWYDNGFLVDKTRVSTGSPSTPTKIGDFNVIFKHEVAFGGVTGQLWKMPKFVGFYLVGNVENGFHALPFINGVKEGVKSLGRAVSHGCIRMDDLMADKFFRWIKIGDKIKVHK